MTTGTSVEVTLTINGIDQAHTVEARTLLAPFLRDALGLTGTKVSCDAQICGACTVLLDDSPISACSTLVVDADGKKLLTVEGLADDEDLSPIQQAFMTEGAFQCGFCTAGQLMTAKWVVDSHADASRDEIAELLHGNICRCGAYPAIISAIQSVIGAQEKA